MQLIMFDFIVKTFDVVTNTFRALGHLQSMIIFFSVDDNRIFEPVVLGGLTVFLVE